MRKDQTLLVVFGTPAEELTAEQELPELLAVSAAVLPAVPVEPSAVLSAVPAETAVSAELRAAAEQEPGSERERSADSWLSSQGSEPEPQTRHIPSEENPPPKQQG